MLRSETVSVTMAPGESTEFSIVFKNTGQATWRRDDRRFVSAYTADPNYRNSAFTDNSWMSAEQPTRLEETEVRPGATGRFRFVLQAPLNPGQYRESFRLAAEDTAWIQGGQFTVNIEVSEDSGKPTAGYRAIKLMTSADSLSIRAGETENFRIAFKNIGQKIWKRNGNPTPQLMAQAGNAYSFRSGDWNGEVAAALKDEEIRPGQISFFDINLRAPSANGRYTASFSLSVNGEPMDGGTISVPIEVYGFSPTPPSYTTGSGSDSSGTVYEPELSASGPKGPNIRIGLFESAGSMTLRAEGPYTLIDGDHQPVVTLSGTTTATFDFATRKYTVTNGSYTYESHKHVHFRPVNPDTTIFEITSHEDRPVWDTTVNYNRFRGQIDFHFISATGKLWVVEDLPVEDYMRGLAETSNGSPLEYQKSLVTAARTYALFVKLIGGKHKAEYFDLDTTGNDQVYRGYTSELIRPQVVQAVEETRGKVVTYGGEIVVTPYFSRSDGRTRAWTEVWSSTPHPWLVSVPAPYDAGLDLWGHGVGMSANDAYGRAKHLGANWIDILKYYYTGAEIRSMY